MLEQTLQNRDHFETLLPAVLLGGKWIMKIYLPPTLQNQRIVRSLERFTKEAAEKFPQVFNLGPVVSPILDRLYKLLYQYFKLIINFLA